MSSSSAVPTPPVSSAYRRYVLGLLLVVYVVNFVDRQILSILAEDIKRDLGLSDTQLGFLTGLSFALFYTLAGIPIARWADRGNRRTIIAIGLGIWSAMTALSGSARGFVQLAAARVGVGIGEAACSPPAHSLIADYFARDTRARALAIYSLGIPIGSSIGLLAGGWLGEYFGWRRAFLVVGLPGLLLALVVRATLREPQRGGSDATETALAEPESLREVLNFLGRLRSFVHLSLAAALHAFVGYGAAAFLPVFLIRVHGMDKGEVGTWLSAIGITAGALGTYFGGEIADRLGRHDPRWYLWTSALSTLLAIPSAVALLLWPDPRTALLLGIPYSVLGMMYLGPTFAMTQSLVRPRMRALASAVLLFVINLIGLGAGPQAVGLISDAWQPRHGSESIRHALLAVVVAGSLWSSLHYVLGARTLARDLRAKDA